MQVDKAASMLHAGVDTGRPKEDQDAATNGSDSEECEDDFEFPGPNPGATAIQRDRTRSAPALSCAEEA